MRLYCLDNVIAELMDESCDTKREAEEVIRAYFESFTEEEKLELLIRGKMHAHEDERTKGYFDR